MRNTTLTRDDAHTCLYSKVDDDVEAPDGELPALTPRCGLAGPAVGNTWGESRRGESKGGGDGGESQRWMDSECERGKPTLASARRNSWKSVFWQTRSSLASCGGGEGNNTVVT